MIDHHTISRRLDVAGTGLTVLDRVYADGVLSDEALGGSCANVLVSLAMLGHCVAPVLRLGADDTGARLVNEFTQAGAVIDFISQLEHLKSPIIAEEIDTITSTHEFNFCCPVTNQNLPRYEPISDIELTNAMRVVSDCAVFYTDRLTPEILTAMQLAEKSGAHVVFEPSTVNDPEIFAEALHVTSVLKTSADRLWKEIDALSGDIVVPVQIVTHGQSGLELRHLKDRHWCPAIPAPMLKDACGSGDMVTVGLIDSLLERHTTGKPLNLGDIIDGVVSGQRLAAENCAFESARGLFRSRGAEYARSLLDRIPN